MEKNKYHSWVATSHGVIYYHPHDLEGTSSCYHVFLGYTSVMTTERITFIFIIS